MKWLKKRDAVIYFLLWKKFKETGFTLYEAYSYLDPYFSKKITKSTIRYMSRAGLAVNKEGKYFLIPLEEYLWVLSLPYLKRRATLRHRIQG
ncbi:hypothetical protein [Metallosphaera hakonensis]|uniref:Uncharacterized protein n=1 Tax=Metallosphaera hakonensis JCM 8857 = DSM 7519 TaxID=1293036 RepID=A0A2U9IV65_9CREN|nr:hypothetical protein [Metallosphaera hakonensis]AWR99949.1 hypothetical protein DFR87_09935 [Metallosphaera hakonensis JCM 8857 = DSM 7519]